MPFYSKPFSIWTNCGFIHDLWIKLLHLIGIEYRFRNSGKSLRKNNKNKPACIQIDMYLPTIEETNHQKATRQTHTHTHKVSSQRKRDTGKIFKTKFKVETTQVFNRAWATGRLTIFSFRFCVRPAFDASKIFVHKTKLI